MVMPFIPRITALLRPRPVHHTVRHALHSSAVLGSKTLPPRRVIPESDMIENFLKGSGPGGQKINKTSSAVQLKHIPTGIVVKYQDTRSRALNRKTARRLLQDRLEELELGGEARTRIKAREKSKKKASSDKKKRRKYRALEAGKEGKDGAEQVDELDELDEVEGDTEVRGEGIADTTQTLESRVRGSKS
ncbi:translation release factor [Ascochyta rabiei]|uniref:Translation release factor n=2 Tax=Didymella rabiei TaxID=5454 RepID=A0A163IX34_DIDRA|nr:translation release factor [Ascochyta rabiei]